MFVIYWFVLGMFVGNFDHVNTVFQQRDDGPCFYEQRRNGRLVKLNGVKVGYYRELNLDGDEKKFRVTTKSLKPTIFEIPNFLSESECEHFKTLAKESGLEASLVGFDEIGYREEIKDVLKKAENPDYVLRIPEFVDDFQEWDKNKDLIVTIDEIQAMCQRSNPGLFLSYDEITDMFHEFNYAHFDDGEMTVEDFDQLPMNKLDAFLIFTQHKHPLHRPRYSDHAWLKNKHDDEVVKKLKERIIRLTELPRKIIEESEHLQVVRYQEHGHYFAHYDSSPNIDLVCCHQNHDRHKECKICRILTILVYLNDVKKGGETAFPAADNSTFDTRILNETFNLSRTCYQSNLLIEAKQGTAIMWYNHDVDTATRWLGNMDEYSVHGGCDVLHGDKWIVNAWINSPTTKSAHVTSLFQRT